MSLDDCPRAWPFQRLVSLPIIGLGVHHDALHGRRWRLPAIVLRNRDGSSRSRSTLLGSNRIPLAGSHGPFMREESGAARVIRFDPAVNRTYRYCHVLVPAWDAGQFYG